MTIKAKQLLFIFISVSYSLYESHLPIFSKKSSRKFGTHVRFSHLLQRLYIRCVRGLLDRPVMLLLWDARPDISIMGSSGTSLARSAVAHGVRRSGLLERIAGGGRSSEMGWLLMSGKVGSRLFLLGGSRDLAMSARKWFRRLPWWKSGRLVIQGGSRNPDCLSGSAGRKRTLSYTTCTVWKLR